MILWFTLNTLPFPACPRVILLFTVKDHQLKRNEEVLRVLSLPQDELRKKKRYSAFDIVGIIPLQFRDKASLEMKVYKPAGCL